MLERTPTNGESLSFSSEESADRSKDHPDVRKGMVLMKLPGV